jgi:hypothetical protein
MTIDRGLLDRIRSRGEEVLTQLSAEMMSNPRFMKALEGAMRGREKLQEAVAGALRQMNVPTRSELKRASARIETLEREVAELRKQVRSRRSAASPRSAARKTTAQR